MKKFLKYTIIPASYIYCIGYIIFDYPTDTYLARGIKGIMSLIFTMSLLGFVSKYFDNALKKIRFLFSLNKKTHPNDEFYIISIKMEDLQNVLSYKIPLVF